MMSQYQRQQWNSNAIHSLQFVCLALYHTGLHHSSEPTYFYLLEMYFLVLLERILYLLHQLKLLFCKTLYCSDSVVLQSLSRRVHQTFVTVVCIMCCRRNCQTTRSENWFGTHLPSLWTCDLRHIISVFLMFLILCIPVNITVCIPVCLAAIWRNNK